jgi:site-specific recombinase XerD
MTALERFAKEYQGYHGLSEERRRQQLKELRALAAYAGKDSPEECNGEDLSGYLAELVDLGFHVNTVRSRANMIRPFFSWLYSVNLIDAERLMAIKSVPNPNGSSGQSTPKPYNAKELKRFWAELDEAWPYRDEKWWARWRAGRSKYKRIATHVMRLQLEAIVAHAQDSGLRRAEIFHLEIDDFHPDNEYILVRQRTERQNGKNRTREVPYTEEARTHVRNWLRVRHELNVGHDRPWISAFANQAEGQWLRPMSYYRFKRVIRTVGDWQLHRFRHTCATNWLRADMDLEVVSRMIGHSSIQQTLAYAEIVRDDIAKQVSRHEGRFQQMTGRRAAA